MSETPDLTKQYEVFSLSGGMSGSAVLSADAKYRYNLIRAWEPASLRLLYVMLNPSVADARRPDATTTRCITFARTMGYGSMEIVNLFAYRSTDPKALGNVHRDEAVGPENDEHIRIAAGRANRIIAAWGNRGDLYNRDREVVSALHSLKMRLFCLGITADGAPKHPLYQGRNARIAPWPTP